jgi:carbon monoxide dehydrogenase subunit G
MKKFLALIALAAFSINAFAHGPSPQKVEKSITIKASPAKVWALVKDFGNLQAWLPPVASSKVEQKKDENGDMATYRTLTLKDGGIINEHLKSIDDQAMKIKYEIVGGVAPVKDYNSTMVVTAGHGADESTVTWTGRFYRLYSLNPPIPPGQDDATAIKFVEGVYDSGLPNLKKVLESSK